MGFLRRLSAGALLLVSLFAAGVAHGMTYQRAGDVLIVTGAVDVTDRALLAAHFKQGSRVLVLRNMAGALDHMDIYDDVATVVRRAGATTVAEGTCSGACAMLFAAGTERRFAAGSPQQPTVVWIGSAGEAMRNAYTFYSRMLRAMPFGLLTRNTAAGKSGRALAGMPSPTQPEGLLYECQQEGSPASCTLVERLTAWSSGLITSPQLFDVPAVAFAQAPAPVQKPAPAPAVESAAEIRAAVLPKPVASAPVAAPQPTPVPAAIVAPAQVPAPPPVPQEPVKQVSTASQVSLVSAMLAASVERGVGPTGIGTVFRRDDKIFAYAAFSWSNTAGGKHVFETRWYRGTEVVVRPAVVPVEWGASPGAVWQSIGADLLGVGSYRVEFVIDGRVVATKAFSVQ